MAQNYIIHVECPKCGCVREVKTRWFQYPRKKNCRDCARQIQVEKERSDPELSKKRVRPPSPVWESDPFTTGQLPLSVTANALWN